jgi:LytS/YehU family sensor histidine kinase
MATQLTEEQRTILNIERQQWTRIGEKLNAIREQLDLTETRYAARLNMLIDTESALAAEPALVNRLRRLRDGNRRTRRHAW